MPLYWLIFYATGTDIRLRRPLPDFPPEEDVAYTFSGVRQNAKEIIEFDEPWTNCIFNAETPTYIAISKLTFGVHCLDDVC